MSVKLKIGLIAGLVLCASSPCLALQSGSRGSVSSVPSTLGSGSRSVVPPIVTPSPSFATPQNFAPAPSLQFQSPSVQPAQSVVGGFVQEQFPNQFQSPGVTVQPESFGPAAGTSLQSSASSSGSSSIGIPASSLVDPIFEISDPNSPYSVSHATWDCFLLSLIHISEPTRPY